MVVLLKKTFNSLSTVAGSKTPHFPIFIHFTVAFSSSVRSTTNKSQHMFTLCAILLWSSGDIDSSKRVFERLQGLGNVFDLPSLEPCVKLVSSKTDIQTN
jgi:hypothetical protein